MEYAEYLPDEAFSHHIESYWQMSNIADISTIPAELLIPTCTFNIIFTEHPCLIRTKMNSNWVPFNPGAAFFGQRNKSIDIQSAKPLKLWGVRFKPFAFANLLNTPIFKLNDSFYPLDKLFEITPSMSVLIHQIIHTGIAQKKVLLLDDLMEALLRKSLAVDEVLRAQLNYIMDRRGAVKIYELFKEFSTNKVTLRKHFIDKVGLTPKRVSQIWRMNYVLKMKEDAPKEKLTTLCLNAGFYDQAHFIKDFKLLFDLPPLKFFSQNKILIQVAHRNISKRFTNQYDPR